MCIYLYLFAMCFVYMYVCVYVCVSLRYVCDCMLCICVCTHVSVVCVCVSIHEAMCCMSLWGICMFACEYFLLCVYTCTCVHVQYVHFVGLNRLCLAAFSFVQRSRVPIQGLVGGSFPTTSPAEA